MKILHNIWKKLEPFCRKGKRYSGFGSQEEVEKFGPTSIIDGAGIGQEWSQLFLNIPLRRSRLSGRTKSTRNIH